MNHKCHAAFLSWVDEVAQPQHRCPEEPHYNLDKPPKPYVPCYRMYYCDDLAYTFCMEACPASKNRKDGLSHCPYAITLPDWLVKNQKRLCKYFFGK